MAFIGQPKIKSILDNVIISSQERNAAAPHLLLFGKSGYGKNTIAYYVAKSLNRNFFHLIGAKLKTEEIIRTLIQSKANDIIFIDEIHALSEKTDEFLYPILEESKVIAKDPKTGAIRSISMEPRTFIAATTNVGKVSKPLLGRFPYVLNLEEYTAEEKVQLVKFKCDSLGVSVNDDAIPLLIEASKGVPRMIHNLLISVRDHCIAHKITANVLAVQDILDMLDIKDGLDKLDRRYLDLLNGTPTSLNTIASNLGIHPDVVRENIEPYLIEKGLVQIVSRGRVKNNCTNEELNISLEDLF